jgi:cell division protein FtsQ
MTDQREVELDQNPRSEEADRARNPRPTPRQTVRFAELPDDDWQPATPWLANLGERITRRQMIFAMTVFVLCAIFGGYGLTRSPLLDLERIDVRGAEHTSPDAVRAASGLQSHVAMTDLDLNAARTAIAALPWVGDVKVSRRWPSTVAVRIVERIPVASVRTPDGIVLVDKTARVLERVDSAPSGLPKLIVIDPPVAPGETQPHVTSLLSVAVQLTPELSAWVNSLTVGPDGSPQLRLRDDVPVIFGEPVRISEKLIDLATVLTRVDLKGICRIDISAVHNPSVARVPNCVR